MIPAFINPHAGNAEAARGALQSVGGFEIHDVPPAAEIVERIATEADQILSGRRNFPATAQRAH